MQTGKSYFWEFEWPAVTRLEIDTQQVEVCTINGGFGLASGEEILPSGSPADSAELVDHRIDPAGRSTTRNL